MSDSGSHSNDIKNRVFEGEEYCPECGKPLLAVTSSEIRSLDVREGIEIHEKYDMVFIHER